MYILPNESSELLQQQLNSPLLTTLEREILKAKYEEVKKQEIFQAWQHHNKLKKHRFFHFQRRVSPNGETKLR